MTNRNTMRHYLPQTVKPLIGKTITAVDRIGDACVHVEFSDSGSVLIDIEGDCCSESIFYEIEDQNGVGGVLTDIIEQSHFDDMADSEEEAVAKVKSGGFDIYIEELRIWNVVLKTTTGIIILRHLNSSNGYYDGSTSYKIIEPETETP